MGFSRNGAAPRASRGCDAIRTSETWYTLNAISPSAPFDAPVNLGYAQAAQKAALAQGIISLPASGRFSVRLAGHGNASPEARDIRGGLMARVEGRENPESGIATAGWASGVYAIRIKDGELSAERRLSIP